MGNVKPPKAVKLFVGLLSGDRDLVRRALQLLRRHYGEIDLQSDRWPFEHTEYYVDELGENAERQFVSFERLIHADAIAEIKRQTNAIESGICDDLSLPPDRRPVNLDPGYMSLSKLVLATTKDFSHRIYLQRGIYAEVTLHFRDGKWQPWPWTYPDYASTECGEFFMIMRQHLKAQLAATSNHERGAAHSE